MIESLVAIVKTALIGAMLAIAVFVIAPMLSWSVWLGMIGFAVLMVLAVIWQGRLDDAAQQRADCLAQLDGIMRGDT